MANNFYCGPQEYAIVFKNGSYNIIEINDSDQECDHKIVFTGNYSKCLSRCDVMQAEYAINCL